MSNVIAEKLITIKGTNSTIFVSLQEDNSGLFLGFLGDLVRDAKEDPYGDFGRSHTIHLFTEKLAENPLVKGFAKEIFWEASQNMMQVPFKPKNFSENSKLWAQYLATVHQAIEKRIRQLPPTLVQQEKLRVA